MTAPEHPPESRGLFSRWLRLHTRKAWSPRTDSVPAALTASKFGGRPWLAYGEEWPTCPHCRRRLSLLLQINLSELPEPEGSGLIQLFYCTNREAGCEEIGEAWQAFSPVVCARLVYPESSAPAICSDRDLPGFHERVITQWRELTGEPPHFDEAWERLEAWGITVDDVWQDGLEALSEPHPGDKLGGWPHWQRQIDYPHCPRCGAEMEMFFQLAGDHLPLRFGDDGCGWLTRCPDHPDVLAFGWADR
ncbi:MAG: DUF1963 domain-containing protein [Candidatus Sericytochromatia bacterium]